MPREKFVPFLEIETVAETQRYLINPSNTWVNSGMWLQWRLIKPELSLDVRCVQNLIRITTILVEACRG